VTRSLAPRPRTRPQPKRVPPDPDAIHHWRCQRCNRLFWARGIEAECIPCVDHALKAFELGPIQVELSGC
jgi:hypothetical protein